MSPHHFHLCLCVYLCSFYFYAHPSDQFYPSTKERQEESSHGDLATNRTMGYKFPPRSGLANPVVRALLAPTSNIAHAVFERRLSQLQGPCGNLRSPSTRAIATNNLSNGSFAHSRSLPPSTETNEVSQLQHHNGNSHFPHVPT